MAGLCALSTGHVGMLNVGQCCFLMCTDSVSDMAVKNVAVLEGAGCGNAVVTFRCVECIPLVTNYDICVRHQQLIQEAMSERPVPWLPQKY
jgi:hypothetical protein